MEDKQNSFYACDVGLGTENSEYDIYYNKYLLKYRNLKRSMEMNRLLLCGKMWQKNAWWNISDDSCIDRNAKKSKLP